MAFQVGAIVAELQLKKDKWDQSIKKVKDDQRSLTGLITRNSQDIKKMGRNMTIAGGAIVGAVGLMVKAYADFDQSMTESLAIMGDLSDETREKMAAMARTISEELTFSAKELAAAYFYLASAGMDAEQSIAALEVVAQFAQAGTFDLALATDLLTDAQTALGLSSKDAIENQENLIRVSDVLVGANTLANASVKQFAEALTNKAAAALVNLNIEMEEGVAVLAAYADKGLKGQIAGQRLTMMLNGLFDATRRNKKAWDEAGISLFKADGSMRAVADIIQDLEGYLGAMTVKQREAALATLGFNLRTKDSILTLMGSSEKIRKWTEDLKDMQGVTKEVSDKQLETFNNQLKLLKNTVTNAAISIGESLAPVLEDLVKDFKDVISKVSEWIKENPGLTAGITKAAAAGGVLLLALGPLVMMLPGIVKGFGLLKIAIVALTGPVGIIAAGFVALAVGMKRTRDGFVDMGDAITDVEQITGTKLSWLEKAFYKVDNAVSKLTTGLDHSKIVQQKYNEELAKAIEKYKDVPNVLDLGKKAIDGVSGALEKGWEWLRSYGKAEEDIIEDTENLEKAQKTLTETIETQLPAVQGIRGEITTWGQDIISVTDLVEGLQDSFEEMTATAIPAARDLSDVWGLAVDNMEQKTEEAVETIIIHFDSMYERFIGLAMSMGDAFGDFAYGLMDKGSTLGENLKGLWTDIGNSFKSMVADYIADEAKKLFLSIISSTKDMASGITSGLASVGKSVAGIGKGLASLITTLAKAIATAATTLAAAAPALLIVGGIALALYAGFKAIGALFAGGKKQTDVTYWLKQITEYTGVTTDKLQGIRDMIDHDTTLFSSINQSTNKIEALLDGRFTAKTNLIVDRLRVIKNINAKIKDNTKGILSALTKKGTVYVDVFRSAVMERTQSALGNKIAGKLGDLGSHLGDRLLGITNEIRDLDLSVDVHVDAPDISGIADAIDEWGKRAGKAVPEFQTGGVIEAGPRQPTLFMFGEGPERERAVISHAGGGSLGGGDININANFNVENLAVRSDEDIERIKEIFKRNIDGLSEEVADSLERFRG